MGKQWNQWQTLFSCGSKITADGDWSHDVKRSLLLGRKTTTNLDSILKSRVISLLTKVHLVKAMVFFSSHVWMWELDYKESWAPKNFERWCWTARRSNQSILKEISPGCSLKGLALKLKLQLFGHLMQRTDSLEKTLMLGKIKGRRRRRWHRMRWLDGIDWLNGHEFEQTPKTVKDTEARCAAVHGVAKSQTRLSDWTTANGLVV